MPPLPQWLKVEYEADKICMSSYNFNEQEPQFNVLGFGWCFSGNKPFGGVVKTATEKLKLVRGNCRRRFVRFVTCNHNYRQLVN